MVRYKLKFNFPTTFIADRPVLNLVGIRLVVSKIRHADRRADITFTLCLNTQKECVM
jgi:hypothetical protein